MKTMVKSSGKTSIIFIILILVLLVSSTAIGFFLYNQENQMRKSLEAQLDESHQQQDKLQADLKDARKQLTLLQDKNKEADHKINSLMDEIELNEGLRNELKKENTSLKDTVESAKKEKDKIRLDLDDKAKKLQEIQDLLKVEQDKTKGLQAKIQDLEQVKQQADALQELKVQTKPSNQLAPDQQINSEAIYPVQKKNNKMELDKIVIGGQDGPKGRILVVDRETEFVICSFGANQGVKPGDVLSVYRGDKYLGDVKVSRVQDEMCAADFIPPFSSHEVRKNDIVVFKKA